MNELDKLKEESEARLELITRLTAKIETFELEIRDDIMTKVEGWMAKAPAGCEGYLCLDCTSQEDWKALRKGGKSEQTGNTNRNPE